MKEVKIGNKTIGKGHPVFMIVEAGVNHNGSLELAKKLVDAAVEAGADVVKFQSFTSEKIAIKEAPKAKYQFETTDAKESQLDMLKKLELNADNFRELKRYCDEKDIMFLSTAHTIDTLDYLDELVPAYKIGSGDLTNIPALKKIAERQKPIILSTGMATMEEVRGAVKAITEINDKLILFHCTTSYPCPREDVNLRAMETLMKEFPDIPIGYSDHTLGIDVSLMAAKLGGVIVEKHFTLDKNMPGPDHKASIEPHELKEMITRLRNKDYPELDEIVLGTYEKKPTEIEIENAKVARKSLIANQDIPKDTIIVREMINIKRPGIGMKPKELYAILGKKALINIKEGELIQKDQIKTKILITGGAGFIGSNLIKKIKNYDIIVYDINKSPLIDGTEFIWGDILDEYKLSKAMKEVDIIIHLAGIKGESNCLKNPVKAILSNIIGTKNVIRQAKLNNVSKIIFASSIYSYSTYKNLGNPIKETNKQEPDTLYGSLKATCEKMIIDSKIPYILLRLSNIYGSETNEGAIGNFVRAAKNNKEITLFCGGNNKIDYLHINDLSEAINKILELELKNEIYNLGGSYPISVIDLAKLSINIAKQNHIYYDKGITDQKTKNKQFADLWLDIEKAKQELNWEPKINLNQGIKEMLLK